MVPEIDDGKVPVETPCFRIDELTLEVPPGLSDAVEAAADEDDAAGFFGDVGAGTDGDAEIGGGECGGVVDSVADHGDSGVGIALAGVLQFTNDLGFFTGLDAGAV